MDTYLSPQQNDSAPRDCTSKTHQTLNTMSGCTLPNTCLSATFRTTTCFLAIHLMRPKLLTTDGLPAYALGCLVRLASPSESTSQSNTMARYICVEEVLEDGKAYPGDASKVVLRAVSLHGRSRHSSNKFGIIGTAGQYE